MHLPLVFIFMRTSIQAYLRQALLIGILSRLILTVKGLIARNLSGDQSQTFLHEAFEAYSISFSGGGLPLAQIMVLIHLLVLIFQGVVVLYHM